MQFMASPSNGESLVPVQTRVVLGGIVYEPAVLIAAVPPKLQAIVAVVLSLSIDRNSRRPLDEAMACAEEFVTVTGVTVRTPEAATAAPIPSSDAAIIETILCRCLIADGCARFICSSLPFLEIRDVSCRASDIDHDAGHRRDRAAAVAVCRRRCGCAIG